MFGRFFRINKKEKQPQPDIPFGRYSDNNKTLQQSNYWTQSENLFKEKKYIESIEAFFNYLRDGAENNVQFQKRENGFSFEIYQGSKVIRGNGEGLHMQALVSLVKMPQLSVPVMRRLLESNYNLFYSRFSLEGEKIYMQFDSDIATANPNKLYYALKELCITSDKQDDLLINDFSLLQLSDSEHIEEVPENIKETKWNAMQSWIKETIDSVKELDAEKFSGAISFLLLSLVFRIDYLITPEGSMMNELEKIQAIYFKKDNLAVIEKNRLMLAAVEKFHSHDKEVFFKSLFRSRSTFSIRVPKTQKVISETIHDANKKIAWYKEHKQTAIAQLIPEYGISYCQYAFSLPKPMIELYKIFMQVNYQDFFISLGFSVDYYSKTENRFKTQNIENDIRHIVAVWKVKYPKFNFPITKLRYNNLLEFNLTFTNIFADLDMDN